MKVNISGTLPELLSIWNWDILCKMIHVDYYNMHLISPTEVFFLNTQSLIDGGFVFHKDSIDETNTVDDAPWGTYDGEY